LAKKLFLKYPEIYKDDNHKPELCCALTDFEAFCGFQSFEKIEKNLKEVEELNKLFEKESLEKFYSEKSKQTMKELFRELFTTKTEIVQEHLERLIKRIENKEEKNIEDGIVLRLYQQYPGDIGCFITYFLNYLILKPGDSLFLDSNEPHAYIYGDCIEIMACSVEIHI
jgi:mannose-6-phosphate isomerase